MRPIIPLCTFAGLALIATPALAAPRYQAADDSAESLLCVSAATDKHLRFRMNLEGTGYSLRSLTKLVTCNGAPIAEFAQIAGNDRLGQLLLRFPQPKGRVEVRDVQGSLGAPATDGVILVTGR